MMSVAKEIIEELQADLDAADKQIERLKAVFDHPGHDFPEQGYLSEITYAVSLLKRYSKVKGGGEVAFSTAVQLNQFVEKAEQALGKAGEK